jgi:hypothetical protein
LNRFCEKVAACDLSHTPSHRNGFELENGMYARDIVQGTAPE